MSLGRLISVLGGVALVGGVAGAQPAAPAPEPAAAPPADGAAVQPIEDAPPSDMEGRDEDPDVPRGIGVSETAPTPGPAPVVNKSGYPIEEAQRPITLPENMSEIAISPRFRTKDPFAFSDTLRARYGITRKVQLGLTYVYGGAFDDPATVESKTGFHAGKTVGLDVTVLITNFMAAKVGLPVYLDPFAMSFAAGLPMKFIFKKFALGALDDVLNIAMPFGAEFAPSFNQELMNAFAAENDVTGSQQSRGIIRIAGYGVYQHKPNLAIIGRVGIDNDLGAGGGSGAGTSSGGGSATFIRGGIQFTPKKFIDLGASLGFDDLARAGSFGLAGHLALRI